MTHYTESNAWLTPPVRKFIAQSRATHAVDPFAGTGNLLQHIKPLGLATAGFEIDPALCDAYGWTRNDSIASIPDHPDHVICITNPPFVHRTHAPRRGIFISFGTAPDYYILALRRCLTAFRYVVAIIPERFLTIDFSQSVGHRLRLIDVIETDDLFTDTQFPVCVACWGPGHPREIAVYKNGIYIKTRHDIMAAIPTEIVDGIKVKAWDGQLGLVSYDSGMIYDPMRFCSPGRVMNSTYRPRVRVSTKIDPTLLIRECNAVLRQLRFDTADLALHPFQKTHAGVRRRRLLTQMTRRIVSRAILSLS